ncbi:hypothetical protein [Luteipulveratus mongoliensis]|uniref:Uncharacterized protein n=1 Tax=Luteipulveratus mongoliensis TaxID=571913 RepID=A0A0K1JJ19_9MICO|nr:hypothetical protein [Luteipulveratus mongoliensis]AKU16593.1 hypothetical protein VV02_13195 [Luteipulveratus mongoliensis]
MGVQEWLGWAGLAIGVLGIAFTVWQMRRKDHGRLAVTTKVSAIVDKAAASSGEVEVEVIVNKAPVANPWLVEIRLRNSGRNRDLSPEHFARSGEISWSLEGCNPIAIVGYDLPPGVTLPTQPELGKKAIWIAEPAAVATLNRQARSVRLSPLLLKTGESISIRLVTSGKPERIETVDRIADFRCRQDLPENSPRAILRYAFVHDKYLQRMTVGMAISAIALAFGVLLTL